MNSVMFSSATDEWATPQDLFDSLDKRVMEDRGIVWQMRKLSKNWGGQSVFCNPPYGRQIGKWVQKALEESQKPGTVVVMLIPARTDTSWFHDYIYGKAEVRFVRGRIKFGEAKNNAPFPSMIVVFGGDGE